MGSRSGLIWEDDHSWSCMTPMSDAGRIKETHEIKRGIMGTYQGWSYMTGGDYYPFLQPMFSSIRVANQCLQNIGMLKDASQKDIDDLIAQAHFVRAFAHFELMKGFGPMPYIAAVVGPDDVWDRERLSKYETLRQVALDMDTAALYFEKAGKMRRDPGPGAVGHLSDPDQMRPNGVAAKAYKGRALLYAASPLNNDQGQKAWEDAAKANWEAIQIAEQYQYDLLVKADYKLNVVGAAYTNEQFWAWVPELKTYDYYGCLIVDGVLAGTKSSYSSEDPTQNTIDMFETKWGDPLNTQADRDKATALGHYNEQDPYTDREPRFYIDIIYNGAPVIGFPNAEIYHYNDNGVTKWGYYQDQSYASWTKTGYYVAKRWNGSSVNNKLLTQFTDPLFRLAELYMNYAEAANEAYGPNTPAPGATMTAVQAVNKIRHRVNHADVLPEYTTSKEVFRPRIRNERTVEFAFEGGHYYHDLRRWMEAPKAYADIMWCMDIEKIPAPTPAYPTGFIYKRIPISTRPGGYARQSVWKDYMYYWPFNLDDNFKMKKFAPNPIWG